jgi:hypothetical protein
VLRHYWAPAHLTDLGPIAPARVDREPADLRDGPLGGLFLDATLIAGFAAVAVNTLLAQACTRQRFSGTATAFRRHGNAGLSAFVLISGTDAIVLVTLTDHDRLRRALAVTPRFSSHARTAVSQYQHSSCCDCKCCNGNCTCPEPEGKMVCEAAVYPPCNLTSPAPITGTCATPVCNASVRAECADARGFQLADGSRFFVLNFQDACDPNCQWESRHSTSTSSLRPPFPSLPPFTVSLPLAVPTFWLGPFGSLRFVSCSVGIDASAGDLSAIHPDLLHLVHMGTGKQ